MARRKSLFCSSSYYYLFNKCLDRRMLFRGNEDYLYFIYLLYYLNQTRPIELRHLNLDFSSNKNYHFKRIPSPSLPYLKIIGFCLLPNSFSLVVRQLSVGGVSDFMQKLGTSYSLHYNKKYARSGSIFCGPFKSLYLDKGLLDQALLFTHLQPFNLFPNNLPRSRYYQVKKYPWSSLPYYLGKRNWSSLLKNNKKLPISFYTKMLKGAILTNKSFLNCINFPRNLNH